MKLEDLNVVSDNINIDEYLDLYSYVRCHMKEPKWLMPFTKDEVLEVLNNGGKIWMYYDSDTPVCSVFYIPANNETLKEYNIDYDESVTGKLGPIMVRQEYQGNGLQYQMMQVVNEYAKSLGKTHMFTKAHADNIYSINNMLKDGYTLVYEYESERGMNKIFVK